MKRPARQFAVCVDNEGYEVSLIVGKIYRVLVDARASKDGLARIIDETGEDYLFETGRFLFVSFPLAVRRRLLALQKAG